MFQKHVTYLAPPPPAYVPLQEIVATIELHRIQEFNN